MTSKQLTPILEAASVFTRTQPPPTPSFPTETEARLGTSLPDSFRTSSFEKDLKVGSYEKSLSPNDLRAIHEMLNSQKNSRSSSNLAKLEAHEMEASVVVGNEKEKGEKDKEKDRSEKSDKTASQLSEEDYSRDSGSDDSDDEFFECNDDIPGAIASLKGIFILVIPLIILRFFHDL
jgi:hypothetical protein